jgi:hypothetical protein
MGLTGIILKVMIEYATIRKLQEVINLINQKIADMNCLNLKK